MKCDSATQFRAGRWLCLGGAILGALGLLGGIVGANLLTTIVPGQPTMMPNTALALLLIGIAGALRQREHSRRGRKTLSVVATLVVLAIGAVTLTEYALDTNLYIDQILVHSETGPYPGRPSPPTVLALTFLAAGLLLFDFRSTAHARPSEWLVLSAGLIALTAFLGLAFGAGPLYRMSRAHLVGVALPTAVSLLLTSLGLLLARPRAGVMRVATSPGPGGVLLRRLAVPAILAPLLLGLAVMRFSAALGIEELSIVLAILASTLTMMALLLLTVTAVALNRTDEVLESIRMRTRNLVEQAPDGIFVADLNGQYTDVNEAGCRMLGYTREEILEKNIVDLLPPADVDRLRRAKDQLLEGAIDFAEWRLRSKDGSWVPVEVSAKILPDRRWQAFVRDVSERKRLEKQAADSRKQLRESEERFRLAFEEAPIGMALLQLDGRFVRVNRVLCQIVGYSAEELTGLTFQAITHPDDLDAELALTGQLYRGEIPRYQLEKRYIHKDGGIVDIMLSGSILRGRAGEPLYYIAQIEEITARKRLENELRLSEAKATGILSTSLDAIISIDEEQRITLFNEGAAKIYGYSKTEAIGAPLDILIPERLRAIHRQHLAKFAASPEIARRMGTRDAVIVGLRKSGEEFPADAAISKLEIAGTRVLTVVLRDITEQKRIEKEQRFLAEVGPVLTTTLDYEDTLSRVAEIAVRSLSDFCIVDLVDDEGEVRRLRVVSRDPSQAWMCEVLHRIPRDPEPAHFVRSALMSKRPVLLQRLSPKDVEALSQTDDHLQALRAIELLSVMAIPLVAHGKLLGAIALLSTTPSRLYGPEDLRVAHELAQRAALAIDNAHLYRAARRAIQVRDEVLGIVAHDLRNPLSTIRLEAGLLRRRGPGPERQSQESGEAIQAAVTRMNRLIQDLLDVTRLEAARLAIEQSRAPAAWVVARTIDVQRALASSASLELRLDLMQDLPDIWADRDRLLQVFENLIGNAIKFTAPGGCITIGAAPRDADVLFWVRDTGSGIPIEDQPHLFDRFWRARAAGRDGAGLGLPIVKGIVEAHGGRVWVESAPGLGSNFLFTIPTAQRVDRTTGDPAPHRTIRGVAPGT